MGIRFLNTKTEKNRRVLECMKKSGGIEDELVILVVTAAN